MRTGALVIAIAMVAAYAAVKLYAVHVAWSVALASLFAGGGIIAIAALLRNAPAAPAPRRRGALPRDPGIPKPPQGAPYRGPQ